MKITFSILISLLITVLITSGCQSEPEKPNILIIFTDDQRMNTLGVYNADCPIETPNLDQLANDGIRFTNGFATTPICVVSRASLLTGRYESNHRVHQFLVDMPDDVFDQSYPVHMRKSGYFVGTFGKYGVGITEEQKGQFDVFQGQANQGPKFREYKGDTLHDAEWLTAMTRDFLEEVSSDKPFCLQLNYKEPHASSVPAPEDDDLLADYQFERSPMDTREEHEKLPEYVQHGFGRRCYDAFFGKNGPNEYMRQYHEKIVSVERSVGKIRQILEEKGIADNTIIIFLSDHGTHFGEKQLGGKWTPYDESLRIPFMVYDPRPDALKGAVLDEMVLNIDVAPTILELAGVPIPEVMDGRSMVSLIHNEKTNWRDHFFFEHYTSPAPVLYIPRNVGVRTEEFKYLKWTDPDPAVEEFYDLRNDPVESNNLMNDFDYQDKVNTVRNMFSQWRRENPSTYEYDPYGRRPQYGAKEIDWEKFEKAQPEVYQKIEAQVKRLNVTWEQALDDWDTRYKICKEVGYWY